MGFLVKIFIISVLKLLKLIFFVKIEKLAQFHWQ